MKSWTIVFAISACLFAVILRGLDRASAAKEDAVLRVRVTELERRADVQERSKQETGTAVEVGARVTPKEIQDSLKVWKAERRRLDAIDDAWVASLDGGGLP